VKDGEDFEIYLPDRELANVWRRFILTQIYNSSSETILNALSLVNDLKQFKMAFTLLLSNRLSYLDVEKPEPEKTYHVFMSGLLASVGMKFFSNRESGYSRYDISALLSDKSIIFEFKKSADTDTESLEKSAKKAIDQIVDNNYIADMPSGKPVYAVGIGFHSKMAEVECKQLR